MNAVPDKKPRCTKCGGALLPDRELGGRTVSVGCVNCGERWFRGVTRRAPTDLERQRVNMKPRGGVGP